MSYFAIGFDIPMTNAVSSSSKTLNPRLRNDSAIDSARVGALFRAGCVLLFGADDRDFTDRDLAFRTMICCPPLRHAMIEATTPSEI